MEQTPITFKHYQVASNLSNKLNYTELHVCIPRILYLTIEIEQLSSEAKTLTE